MTLTAGKLYGKFKQAEDIKLMIGEQTLTVRLKEFKDLVSSLPDQVAFSVLLGVEHDGGLDQGMYLLDVDGDKVEVFLVPVGFDDGTANMELIFN